MWGTGKRVIKDPGEIVGLEKGVMVACPQGGKLGRGVSWGEGSPWWGVLPFFDFKLFTSVGAPHLGSLGRSRGLDQLRNLKVHCKIQMQSLLFRNYYEFQDSKSVALNRLPRPQVPGNFSTTYFPSTTCS